MREDEGREVIERLRARLAVLDNDWSHDPEGLALAASEWQAHLSLPDVRALLDAWDADSARLESCADLIERANANAAFWRARAEAAERERDEARRGRDLAEATVDHLRRATISARANILALTDTTVTPKEGDVTT